MSSSSATSQGPSHDTPDKRMYFPVYTNGSPSFIARDGTDMKGQSVSFIPIETLKNDTDDQLLQLVAIAYSKEKTQAYLSMKPPPMVMSTMFGPDVLQVIDKYDNTYINVWQAVKLDALELCTYRVKSELISKTITTEGEPDRVAMVRRNTEKQIGHEVMDIPKTNVTTSVRTAMLEALNKLTGKTWSKYIQFNVYTLELTEMTSEEFDQQMEEIMKARQLRIDGEEEEEEEEEVKTK